MPEPNATPTTVDVKSLRFELVGKSPGGPVKLTARVFVKICRHIENGASICTACRLEGVTYRIFRLRVANSETLQRRLKQAEQQRAHVRFEGACESIMQAGETSWMAHAWWLERSYPQLFALRTVNRDNPDAKQTLPEIPAEILAKHRRLMIEMLQAAEAADQANQAALPAPKTPDSEHSTK